MLSYSKASRGLIVLDNIDGILTAILISRISFARQQPGRYVIHAGHQLNAEEFRYFMTVIVVIVARGFQPGPEFKTVRESFPSYGSSWKRATL